MSNDETVKLTPCSECKDQPKKDCKRCGGTGKVVAGSQTNK